MTSEKPLIIAHRGSSAKLPENTLQAFNDTASKKSCEMIEFDVRLSRDGIPVIIHDSRLERTTNGKGYVRHYDLESLQKLDAAFHFDPENNRSFPYREQGFKIPTLQEMVSAFPDIPFAAEIKENSTELTHQVVKILESFGKAETAVIGSKYHKVSQTMQSHYPHLQRFCSRRDILGVLLELRRRKRNPKSDPSGVASVPIHFFGVSFESEEWIDFLHRKNMRAFFWTIDDPATIESLADKGADGIITNNPELAARTLGREI